MNVINSSFTFIRFDVNNWQYAFWAVIRCLLSHRAHLYQLNEPLVENDDDIVFDYIWLDYFSNTISSQWNQIFLAKLHLGSINKIKCIQFRKYATKQWQTLFVLILSLYPNHIFTSSYSATKTASNFQLETQAKLSWLLQITFLAILLLFWLKFNFSTDLFTLGPLRKVAAAEEKNMSTWICVEMLNLSIHLNSISALIPIVTQLFV